MLSFWNIEGRVTVRALSDPSKHIVNQVEIRHSRDTLRIKFIVNSLKNEEYTYKTKKTLEQFFPKKYLIEIIEM